jgi:SAM-dependent methyltransferase
MEDVFSRIERNINSLAEQQVAWSLCASSLQLAHARAGQVELPFGTEYIPCDWLGNVQGKKVLCLAGAGGMQAPLLACAGADVTVLDLSERMLDRDREMAAREKLAIRVEHGNMCDLSCFADASFDLVVNPPSLFYVPDVMPVFREVFRVLKPGGSFIMVATNPIAYVCDWDEKLGLYKAVNHMPYCSADHVDQGDWIEYGHTMEHYIGGQLQCGFVLTGYKECQMDDITELYFITRGEKR